MSVKDNKNLENYFVWRGIFNKISLNLGNNLRNSGNGFQFENRYFCVVEFKTFTTMKKLIFILMICISAVATAQTADDEKALLNLSDKSIPTSTSPQRSADTK